MSVDAVEAPEVVTSEWIDNELAATYERTGLKPGQLSNLAGIDARRWWNDDVGFADAAAMAGEAAIIAAGIDPAQIGMMISTSVCKDHLEPSMACAIHVDLRDSWYDRGVVGAAVTFRRTSRHRRPGWRPVDGFAADRRP